jgi:uncharacterized integral membrane protein (TIGR00697 family)
MQAMFPSSKDPTDSQLAATISRRRENVFLVLSGFFLGTLTMLNLLGITRFIDLSFTLPFVGITVPMILAVGVLPYPLTFLCTDLLSEFYGKRRTNAVVMTGLALNAWVVFILWLGGALPGAGEGDASEVFFGLRELAFGAVTASMVAYLAAQLIDVQLFHFWKRLTNGRHLWLRNNGSTMVSQLVDSVAVITITHYWAGALPIDPARPVAAQLLVFISSAYVFKFTIALLDTGPFYIAVAWLSDYLQLDPNQQD